MKDIKKLMITLVALLALTTGAWADETPLLTIWSEDYELFTSESKTFDDKVTVTFSNLVLNYGDNMGWYTFGSSLLTVAGTNGYTITSCKFYTNDGIAKTGYTVEGESPSVYLYDGYVYIDANKSVKIGEPGVTKIEVYGAAASSASTVEVTWTAATNSGTFKMPGGNVTLEPEYYDQATVADGGVTAADADARATTDDPLVKVDATKLTGAKKLMYFVSNSGTTAPAYDAEGWTDQLPTAEGFTQQGIVYVWYYPVGIDEGVDGATATFSDGDICLQSITARIAAAPTYAVTFAEGVNPEAPAEPEWTASPNTDVTKGETVTVTYTGSKKVIGVKAEKKSGAVDPAKAYLTWDADQKKLVATEIPAGATVVENKTTGVTWSEGTYVVEGEVTINGVILLSGNVNLIIKDGATLTAQRISGNSKELRIYGQAQMKGELVVSSDDDGITSINTLEVHSAQVTATSSGNSRGGFFYIGTFNVYGGLVDAKCTGVGYGIGLKPGGFMNIFGGEVKAVGKGNSSKSNGIYGGDPVDKATVTVFGGKLWAGNADDKALRYVTLTIDKSLGFNGEIETSPDNSTWHETVGTPDEKYVRVGY